MCCQFPNLQPAVQKISESFAGIDTFCGQAAGLIAYGEEMVLTPVWGATVSCATKTASFVKTHWRELVAYAFAWGIIITCTGLMYGFEAVALPLTIGITCGLFFGVLMGVIVVKVLDPSGTKTPWNFLNEMIEKLDANGTKQIVLAVAVTVILAAAVVFPYVIGAVLGFMVGFQFAAKAGADQPEKDTPQQESPEMKEIRDRYNKMAGKIDVIFADIEKLKLDVQVNKSLPAHRRLPSNDHPV